MEQRVSTNLRRTKSKVLKKFQENEFSKDFRTFKKICIQNDYSTRLTWIEGRYFFQNLDSNHSWSLVMAVQYFASAKNIFFFMNRLCKARMIGNRVNKLLVRNFINDMNFCCYRYLVQTQRNYNSGMRIIIYQAQFKKQIFELLTYLRISEYMRKSNRIEICFSNLNV